MAELKKEFETLGFENVITYLNSGNVIFTSDIQDENTITNTIHKMIEEKFKLDIPVFIIEASKLKELLENQPEWWGTVSKEIYDNIIFIIPPTTYEEVHKALGEPKQELEKIKEYNLVIQLKRLQKNKLVGKNSKYKHKPINYNKNCKYNEESIGIVP